MGFLVIRRPDWELRLWAYLAVADARGAIDFRTWDCARFAAGAIEAVTGTCVAVEMFKRYRAAPGAARLLAAGGGLQALVCTTLGAPVSALAARRGDVALIGRDGDAALGVVLGAQVAVLAPAGGWRAERLDRATCAWWVG